MENPTFIETALKVTPMVNSAAASAENDFKNLSELANQVNIAKLVKYAKELSDGEDEEE